MHLFNLDKFQEHQRRHLGSHDNPPPGMWRKRRSPEFYNEFPFREGYHHRQHSAKVHDHHERHQDPRQRHYLPEDPSRVPRSRYFDPPPSRMTGEVPLPFMHKQPIAEPGWRHDRPPHYPPRNIYPGGNIPVRAPEVEHKDHIRYTRPYDVPLGRHYAPEVPVSRYRAMDTDHRFRDTDYRNCTSSGSDNAHERLHHDHGMHHSSTHHNRNRPSCHTDTEAPQLGDLINESLQQYGKKKEKLPPKPISFKIKSTNSEENSLHPLDRLAPPVVNRKELSPKRWGILFSVLVKVIFKTQTTLVLLELPSPCDIAWFESVSSRNVQSTKSSASG